MFQLGSMQHVLIDRFVSMTRPSEKPIKTEQRCLLDVYYITNTSGNIKPASCYRPFSKPVTSTETDSIQTECGMRESVTALTRPIRRLRCHHVTKRPAPLETRISITEIDYLLTVNSCYLSSNGLIYLLISHTLNLACVSIGCCRCSCCCCCCCFVSTRLICIMRRNGTRFRRGLDLAVHWNSSKDSKGSKNLKQTEAMAQSISVIVSNSSTCERQNNTVN